MADLPTPKELKRAAELLRDTRYRMPTADEGEIIHLAAKLDKLAEIAALVACNGK